MSVHPSESHQAIWRCAAVFVAAAGMFGASGCIDTTVDAGDQAPPDSVGESITIGDSGDTVRWVHDHLTRFGYLPSPWLAEQGFVPAVDNLPDDDNVFDEVSEAAVLAYQKTHGLEPSGVVGADTLARMKEPRCGFPDAGRAPKTSSVTYFHPTDTTWNQGEHLTYVFDSYVPGASPAEVHEAFRRATNAWSSRIDLSFEQVSHTYPDPDITIYFYSRNQGPPGSPVFDGPGGVKGYAHFPRSGRIFFDADENWYYGIDAALPPGQADFITLATHELGHAIGLAHSSISASIMKAFPGEETERNYPRADDLVAARYLYPLEWERMPGSANDISSIDGNTWVIGKNRVNGGYSPYRWQYDRGSFRYRWVKYPGGGVRIAASPTASRWQGRPWLINDSQNIFRYEANGTWTKLPGRGRDIAVAGNGEVFMLGQAGGRNGHEVYTWRVSQNRWDKIEGKRGVRIAADSVAPYVVDANRDVFRWTGGADWEQLPETARHIGGGTGGIMWKVSYVSDFPVGVPHVWNKQPAGNVGIDPAEARYEWLSFGGAGHTITGGPAPWLITNFGTIYRQPTFKPLVIEP